MDQPCSEGAAWFKKPLSLLVRETLEGIWSLAIYYRDIQCGLQQKKRDFLSQLGNSKGVWKQKNKKVLHTSEPVLEVELTQSVTQRLFGEISFQAGLPFLQKKKSLSLQALAFRTTWLAWGLGTVNLCNSILAVDRVWITNNKQAHRPTYHLPGSIRLRSKCSDSFRKTRKHAPREKAYSSHELISRKMPQADVTEYQESALGLGKERNTSSS